MRDTVVDKRILKLNKNIHPNKKSTKILFKLFTDFFTWNKFFSYIFLNIFDNV